MNKKKWIHAISQKHPEMSEKEVKGIINTAIHLLTDCVKSNDTATISGFGTFTPVCYKERTGTNPKTKKTMFVKQRNSLRFKPGKTLLRSINETS